MRILCFNFDRIFVMNSDSDNRNYKWVALALIWAAVFCQQGVRQIYSATLPSVMSSLNITSVEIGMVGTVFTFIYGITVLSAGFVSDLLSRKWVLVTGVLLFAIGGLCSGFASCVGALVVSYGIFNGLGQPLVFPPGMSLLMQLHGEDTRATALSTMQSAIYIGIIVCAIGSGALATLGEAGWRGPYWIVGGMGLLCFLLMVFLLKDTKSVKADPADKASLGEALKAIAGKPSAILYGAYLILLNFVTIGFMIWTPALVKDSFPQLSLREAVFHAVVWLNVCALLGVMVGGRLGDRFAVRRRTVRLEILSLGVLGSAFAWFFVAVSPSLPLCCVSLAFAGFSRGLLDSNLNVAFFDVIKPRYHASALGFMLGLSFIFGSIAPVMLGWTRQAFTLRAGIMTFPIFYLLALGLILWSRFGFYLRDREDR